MSKKDAKDKEEVKVVPELTIEWADGIETVRTFDTAWHRLLEAPVPARSRFRGVVRPNSPLGVYKR